MRTPFPMLLASVGIASLLAFPSPVAAQAPDYAVYGVILERVPGERLSIFARAEFEPNATWTDYRGFDPEIDAWTDYTGLDPEILYSRVPDNVPRALLTPFVTPYPQGPRTLRRSFRLSRPYQLVSPQDLEGSAEGATDVHLSPVVFDNGRQMALVRVAFECGARCTRGTFFVLSRQGRRWVITEEIGFPNFH